MTMTDIASLPSEGHREVEFPCLVIEQPIGPLYVGVVPYKTLLEITRFDIRHTVQQEGRDVGTYLGIQRQIRKDRVEELQQYVNFKDASFPTGIIIAVKSDCASYDSDRKIM